MPQTNRHEIAEIVTRLLNHYPTSDEPVAIRAAIAQDWIDDLEEFTPAQVKWATTRWRQTQSLRPTIAEIRTLATEAQHRDNESGAITDQGGTPNELDADTLKMWAGAEYHGDFRTPMQRRQAEIDAQEEKYRRGQAWRDGKLDEYDAVHHPEKLRERQRQAHAAASRTSAASTFSPIGQVMAEMGVTAEPSVTATPTSPEGKQAAE